MVVLVVSSIVVRDPERIVLVIERTMVAVVELAKVELLFEALGDTVEEAELVSPFAVEEFAAMLLLESVIDGLGIGGTPVPWPLLSGMLDVMFG